MDLKELKKIGLTEGEIKVYSALLELGETTKTKLAKESGIAPSNIYDVTNRLVEKGIISKVEINGVAHFSPANPNHLLRFVEKKTLELEQEQAIAKSILPTLLMKFNEKKEKSKVEVFEGWSGMKTVFEEMIEECNKNDECLVFGASRGESEKTADAFFTKYSKLREQKGIKTKIIFNKSVKNTSRIKYFENSKNYQLKFIDQSTPAEIMIYKNKTCIIMLTKEPMVIRINGTEARDSFKAQFDILWKDAK